MHKIKSLFLILLAVIMLLCACGTTAPVETTESTDPIMVETEPATVPTEAETIPEETLPPAMEITDFVLETIDGVDYYTMNDFSYPASLGAPKLGLSAVKELFAQGDPEAAAKEIDSIADAIHYVAQMPPLSSSWEACEAFVRLLEDGSILTLRGEGFTYSLVFIDWDIYYPIDIYNLANGWSSWVYLPENQSLPTKDGKSLCEAIASTYPGENDVKSWIMDAYTVNDENSPTSHLYPWELSDSVLGPEKVAQLYAAGNRYAAQKAITTVADAIEYLKLLDPDTWFNDPSVHNVFTRFVFLVADDYEDVGYVNFMQRKPQHREGFYDQTAYFGGYWMAYVKKDGIYYSVDLIDILTGWTSPTLFPRNESYSNTDLNELCAKMAATIKNPWDPQMTYWEITSGMYHQDIKLIPLSEFVIPEVLGHPVLSDEEIEALIHETDYNKIAEEITTLGDALNFYNMLRLVEPQYRRSNVHGAFVYSQSAWQALKDKAGRAASVCSLTRYLLKEDYDEVGYVLMQSANNHSQMMYIYDDGLYYLLQAGEYSRDPRSFLWIEWPDLIGCAEDFQTIANSAVEHMWFQAPSLSEQVKEVYLIRCEGDFVYGINRKDNRTLVFPEGMDVTSYFGTEFTYEEAALDWQSQTRIDY